MTYCMHLEAVEMNLFNQHLLNPACCKNMKSDQIVLIQTDVQQRNRSLHLLHFLMKARQYKSHNTTCIVCLQQKLIIKTRLNVFFFFTHSGKLLFLPLSQMDANSH